jgi:hypothetical protein
MIEYVQRIYNGHLFAAAMTEEAKDLMAGWELVCIHPYIDLTDDLVQYIATYRRSRITLEEFYESKRNSMGELKI